MHNLVSHNQLAGWNPHVSETEESTTEIIQHYVTEVQLFEILSEISSILFFLMGAMTIVEIIDIHGGFRVVTDRIKTTSKIGRASCRERV